MSYTLITGAAGGLGAALAKVLAAKGEKLLLVARRAGQLDALAAELSGDHVTFCCDLSRADDVDKLKDFALQTLGVPATILNCAGSGIFGALEQLDTYDIACTLNNNLLPVILPCQAFVKEMKEAGGVIANMMSTAALKGKNGETVYCAAKWGVRGFTEALREETRGSAVRVVAVYPAGMATRFWDETGVDYPVDSFMTAEEAAEMIASALIQAKKGFISDITLSR